MHSTPPTNTPIDSKRRRLLAVAAGASVASVGALTVAAMPDSAACAVDPIFAAMDAVRQASAAMVAVEGNIPDELADPYYAARTLVMRTRPTTPAGLAALTTWMREEADELRKDGSMLYADDLYALSASLDDAARSMSGLKAWSPAEGAS